MAWLEFHQTMPKHRKTLKLASLLKTSRREAIGLMADLWCWGLDNADDSGRLPGASDRDIAVALEYPPKKGPALVSALLESGFLDTDEDGITYRLHDWDQYAGRLNERRMIKRQQDRARQQNRRDRMEKERDIERPVTRDTAVNRSSTVPNRTLPYPTVPNPTRTIDTESTRESGAPESAPPPPPAPKNPERHKHGEYGWVRLTEAEYARLVADHGEDTVRRYIDYVDKSAQLTGNKNGWKDWNLTVRKAIRESWGGGTRETDLQRRKRILDEKIKRDMEADKNGDTGGDPKAGKTHAELLPGSEGKPGG